MCKFEILNKKVGSPLSKKKILTEIWGTFSSFLSRINMAPNGDSDQTTQILANIIRKYIYNFSIFYICWSLKLVCQCKVKKSIGHRSYFLTTG